jgi:phosphoribosyl 1,2-cyclic phosphodiesterase
MMPGMVHLTILGTGSAGNAAVVESDKTRLLIDAGLSARRICQRLGEIGIAPESLDGILLTHEHQDHAQGLAVFCKKHPVPIYCNSHTAAVLRSELPEGFGDWRIFPTGADFVVGDVTAHAFSVPHDAADPVGFTLTCGASSIGYLTDLGYATKLVLERIRNVHTLVIETNHDEKLLQEDTRRPWSIKQRILSRHGHLSNTAAAEVVAQIAGNGLARVLLSHLSRDCNRPELAEAAIRQRLAQMGCTQMHIEAIPHGASSARFTAFAA